jgi:taurine transport system permease protein
MQDKGRFALPLRSVLSLAAGLLLWQLIASSGWVAEYQLPRPSVIVEAFLDVAAIGYAGASLWESLIISAERLAAGLSAGIAVGVIGGYCIASSRIISGLLDPIVDFVRCIPPLAILSLLVIWFGIGEESKIVMLLLAAMIPVLLATVHAIRTIRRERIDGARSLGLLGLGLLRYVIFMSALPDILTGTRIGFGYSFGSLVAAETLGASSGMGWMVWNASMYLQTSVVCVCIIIIGCVGFLADLALQALHTRLVPWARYG